MEKTGGNRALSKVSRSSRREVGWARAYKEHTPNAIFKCVACAKLQPGTHCTSYKPRAFPRKLLLYEHYMRRSAMPGRHRKAANTTLGTEYSVPCVSDISSRESVRLLSRANSPPRPAGLPANLLYIPKERSPNHETLGFERSWTTTYKRQIILSQELNIPFSTGGDFGRIEELDNMRHIIVKYTYFSSKALVAIYLDVIGNLILTTGT